jgi:dolichyl-phosphate beta-glucosyltransferase
MLTPPSLSVVIPAYNEARRLPTSLRRVLDFLERGGQSFEIVVVDDGSDDDTSSCVRALGHPAVTLVGNERNRGKGYSVRRGMLLARGERRLMTDADLSTPIEELPRLIAALVEGADVAVGSRAASGADIVVHQPWYREVVGRLFNLAVRSLTVRGIRDTQCGFKLFSGPAAREVFASLRLDGFSFDVEALFVAQKRGYRLVEIPVRWSNDAASRVTVRKGALAFLDLLRIRCNQALGRYRPGSGSAAT